MIACREGLLRRECRCCGAGVEQYRNGIVGVIRYDKVSLAVAIQIRDRDGTWEAAGCEGLLRGKARNRSDTGAAARNQLKCNVAVRTGIWVQGDRYRRTARSRRNVDRARCGGIIRAGVSRSIDGVIAKHRVVT